jgi:hypothetical protein
MPMLWAYTDYDNVYDCIYIPRQLATLDGSQSVHARNIDIAWVAYQSPTTPWRWQPLAETWRGKIWNALIKSTSSLTHLLVILQRYYKMIGPTIKMYFMKCICWCINYSSSISHHISALQNTFHSKSLSLTGIKYFRTTKCNKAQKTVEVKYSVSQVKQKSATGM